MIRGFVGEVMKRKDSSYAQRFFEHLKERIQSAFCFPAAPPAPDTSATPAHKHLPQSSPSTRWHKADALQCLMATLALVPPSIKTVQVHYILHIPRTVFFFFELTKFASLVARERCSIQRKVAQGRKDFEGTSGAPPIEETERGEPDSHQATQIQRSSRV